VVIHAQTIIDVEQLLGTLFFSNKIVVKISEIHQTVDCNTSLEELNKINVAVLHGYLCVIENGAVLVTREQMFHPALPFLCEHLVLILPTTKLVNSMIEAYQASTTLMDQYTVFISGPSKTADIEQSLVIGAHGPKTLTIFLLG
jgi:L-lactate dehydrogenase complex protein LldG